MEKNAKNGTLVWKERMPNPVYTVFWQQWLLWFRKAIIFSTASQSQTFPESDKMVDKLAMSASAWRLLSTSLLARRPVAGLPCRIVFSLALTPCNRSWAANSLLILDVEAPLAAVDVDVAVVDVDEAIIDVDEAIFDVDEAIVDVDEAIVDVDEAVI